MKKRMEENDKMEKEIQERKKDCFKKKNELGPNPYFDHPLHVNAHRLHN